MASRLYNLFLVLVALNNPVLAKNFEKDQEKYFKKYMDKVQSTIKKNWHPDTSYTSPYTFEYVFEIDKDGKAYNLHTKDLSPLIDNNVVSGARAAIEASSPFEKQDLKFFDQDPIIEFTFDYKYHPKKENEKLLSKTKSLKYKELVEDINVDGVNPKQILIVHFREDLHDGLVRENQKKKIIVSKALKNNDDYSFSRANSGLAEIEYMPQGAPDLNPVFTIRPFVAQQYRETLSINPFNYLAGAIIPLDEDDYNGMTKVAASRKFYCFL